MDIKLPCVWSLEEYWEALCSKKVSFCEIPDSRKALLLPHNNATTVKYCSEVVHGDIACLITIILGSHKVKQRRWTLSTNRSGVLCSAGIEPFSLLGKNVGVYMGVHYQDYQQCNPLQLVYTATGMSLNNISNQCPWCYWSFHYCNGLFCLFGCCWSCSYLHCDLCQILAFLLLHNN